MGTISTKRQRRQSLNAKHVQLAEQITKETERKVKKYLLEKKKKEKEKHNMKSRKPKRAEAVRKKRVPRKSSRAVIKSKGYA